MELSDASLQYNFACLINRLIFIATTAFRLYIGCFLKDGQNFTYPYMLIVGVKCNFTCEGTFIREKHSCLKIWIHRALLQEPAGEFHTTRIIPLSQFLDSLNMIRMQTFILQYSPCRGV
ncbi:hypothetical protein AVEN_255568-1 [Araneus ventricosus]|uniref:Uncharacterized protein n=1 Tax=Araneus ventricosus TaxID=182803 RepID=A0A4Y2UN54_ARAVE|nr:hypothetical protein AVEN_255568-1 [Araneus ventricosus]